MDIGNDRRHTIINRVRLIRDQQLIKTEYIITEMKGS